MFAVYCPRHRRAVLLSASDITAVHNREEGIEVHWRCSCGEEGMLWTGPGSSQEMTG
jgi:hypothetical protein